MIEKLENKGYFNLIPYYDFSLIYLETIRLLHKSPKENTIKVKLIIEDNNSNSTKV